MIHTSPNLSISMSKESSMKGLVFNFNGKFTEEDSAMGTQVWSKVFDTNPSDKFTFTWNCTHMNGFEIGARKKWYDCMDKYKNQISKVVVISNSIIIRSAARVMLSYFGINAEILKVMA